MELQRTTGGGLLQTTGGALANACCCGPSCPDPQVVATITAADVDIPVGGVPWLGFTWIKSTQTKGANDRHSGESAIVCPDLYFKGTMQTTVTGSFGTLDINHHSSHIWRKSTYELSMHRQINKHWQQFGTFGFCIYVEHRNRLIFKPYNTTNKQDSVRWIVSCCPSLPCPSANPTATIVVSNQLKHIVSHTTLGTVAMPTPFSYNLYGQFFNVKSHTYNNITYSWAKGAGPPSWP